MKKAKNGGYSLVEVLVAIALLAIITIPTYTSLTLSVKINAKTDEMLKAQLAVSSAVETLMAEGIKPNGTATVDSAVRTALEAAGVSVEEGTILRPVVSPADDIIVVYHCQCAGGTHVEGSSYKVTVFYDSKDNENKNISVAVTTCVPHQKIITEVETPDPTETAAEAAGEGGSQ